MDAKRILLVDDEEPILFAVSEYFKGRGYLVHCARELEEAQALLLHIHYECLIADVRLTSSHGAEGLELVSFVRRICARTRIVLLTAFASAELERSAIARGSDGFVQKPIALSQLARLVQELTEASC